MQIVCGTRKEKWTLITRACRGLQKRATKLIPESKKSYSDRLKALKLPTLKYRRYRGDMLEVFKIMKGIYDPACVPHFEYTELTDNLIRTSGNKFKLVQHHCH